jgi:hypothetical protein
VGDPALSFITAKCTQETLPYTFKTLPDGSFSEVREGTIEVNHFSSHAVEGKISDYAFCTYYVSKQPNAYEAHITVTPNLKLQLNKVRKEYAGNEKGQFATGQITKEDISLEIPSPPDDIGVSGGAWRKDGWELKLLKRPPKVQLCPLQKFAVNSYEPGKVIPYFSIGMKLKDTSKPKSLEQELLFDGVEPSTIMTLSREPAQRSAAGDGETERPAVSSINTVGAVPRLALLGKLTTRDGQRIEIIKTIAPRWQDIAVHLDFDPTGLTLRQIQADEGGKGVKSCCRAMFQYWLEGNGRKPVSWDTLLEILEDCNYGALAAQIKSTLQEPNWCETSVEA